MARLESLNSFFIERLMSVAGEIFEAVKETVSEYQEEMKRTKQENQRLREKLTEFSVSISCEQQAAGQKKIPQTSLDSETSVIHLKLDLASVKQEAEPQHVTTDAASISGKNVHDTQPSRMDRHLSVHQNSSLELQDSEALLMQVKLKPTSTEEVKLHQECVQTENLAYGQEQPLPMFLAVLDVERNSDDQQQGSSFITTRADNNRQVNHKNTSTCVPQTQSVQGDYDDTMTVESGVWLSERISEHFYPGTACSQSIPDNNSYTCNRCGKVCSSAWFLKKHLVTHYMEKPYVCDLCGKYCYHKQLLKSHLKTHSARRPFQCSICAKTYKLKHHLKDHLRTHTGDKRYSCSACGMGFVWINQVKVHIQNHHRGQMATVLKKGVKHAFKEDSS